jgi:NAD(P)-dependent dehydrogenase (short-subunit alcohol dehydrogenase family)
MGMQKWTTHSIDSLEGKVMVVTGGNSGLGYESAKVFAEKGATVVIGSRSMEKANAAMRAIEKEVPHAVVHTIQLDLMDLKSVATFVKHFTAEFDRLDVLLNNAGIMMNPYTKTKDGFESQIGTNHLGHFALTGQLLPQIVATPHSRVVNVSSNAHKWGTMDFEDFLFANGNGYTPMKAYGRSKLANLLFTYDLQRKFDTHKIDSLSVAAHPGISTTNLGRHLEDKLLYKLLLPFAPIFTQKPSLGALPQIRAALDASVKPASYYGPGGFNQMKGAPVEVQSNDASHNRKDAEVLWKLSEELTGVKFNF